MEFVVSYLLLWSLIFLSSVSWIQMAPLHQTSTSLYTADMSTIDYLTLFDYTSDAVCNGCCETRTHGHLVVVAEIIQSDCTSSSFQPYSSTMLPYSTTRYRSKQTSSPIISSTNSSLTSSVLSSHSSSPLTTSSSSSSSSSTSSSTSSTTSSTTSSSTSPISTTSTSTSTPTTSATSLTTSTSVPSSPVHSSSIATLSTKESLTTTVGVSSSSHLTSHLSTFFPSTFGPSSTMPDYSCGIGEICCETRTIGHIVILATIIDESKGETSTSPHPFTTNIYSPSVSLLSK